MFQRVEVLGHLGGDPEIRVTGSGSKVASFSIAAGEKWKDKDGEPKEHTEWFRCSAFGNLAEVFERYTKKGQAVFISGRLRTDKVEEKGETKYYTKLIVNELKLLPTGERRTNQGDEEESERAAPRTNTKDWTKSSKDPAKAESKPSDNIGFDDDIPF